MLDAQEAAVAARRVRANGGTVVFTNGVFDLMHAGHLKTIWSARALGDLLVVGINSDASVRRLKGPRRRFVGHRLRALMLAGLEAIDYVVVFAEDTPLRLIQAVQPDVLVKGGDWKGMQIVERDVVEAASLEQRRVGGLGWYLVRRLMHGIHHRPLGPVGNEVTLVRRLDGGRPEAGT